MDKKNKIFFLVLFLLLFGTVAANYYRAIIKKDYIVEGQIDCDPASENCFFWECDPASEAEEEACTGDPESDIYYYKLAYRRLFRVPLCNSEEDEACAPWACNFNENDCGEIFCDENTSIEQEAPCSYWEEYLENNLPDEEEECEEGDEVCAAEEEDASVCDSESEEGCPENEAAPVNEGDGQD